MAATLTRCVVPGPRDAACAYAGRLFSGRPILGGGERDQLFWASSRCARARAGGSLALRGRVVGHHRQNRCLATRNALRAGHGAGAFLVAQSAPNSPSAGAQQRCRALCARSRVGERRLGAHCPGCAWRGRQRARRARERALGICPRQFEVSRHPSQLRVAASAHF